MKKSICICLTAILCLCRCSCANSIKNSPDERSRLVNNYETHNQGGGHGFGRPLNRGNGPGGPIADAILDRNPGLNSTQVAKLVEVSNTYRDKLKNSAITEKLENNYRNGESIREFLAKIKDLDWKFSCGQREEGLNGVMPSSGGFSGETFYNSENFKFFVEEQSEFVKLIISDLENFDATKVDCTKYDALKKAVSLIENAELVIGNIIVRDEDLHRELIKTVEDKKKNFNTIEYEYLKYKYPGIDEKDLKKINQIKNTSKPHSIYDNIQVNISTDPYKYCGGCNDAKNKFTIYFKKDYEKCMASEVIDGRGDFNADNVCLTTDNVLVEALHLGKKDDISLPINLMLPSNVELKFKSTKDERNIEFAVGKLPFGKKVDVSITWPKISDDKFADQKISSCVFEDLGSGRYELKLVVDGKLNVYNIADDKHRIEIENKLDGTVDCVVS